MQNTQLHSINKNLYVKFKYLKMEQRLSYQELHEQNHEFRSWSWGEILQFPCFFIDPGERGQCVLDTPPKILFCDLRLDPGESKTCKKLHLKQTLLDDALHFLFVQRLCCLHSRNFSNKKWSPTIRGWYFTENWLMTQDQQSAWPKFSYM